MRLMGLDVGDATIGVAVSDELGWIAHGVCTIRRKSLNEDLKQLDEIIKEKNIDKIVIGLPKNMNNTIGERGNKSIEFEEIIKSAYPELETVLWDERLTTAAAQRTLLEANVSRKNRKKVIDKIAAIFILQSYMDAQKNS
ncbi:MAG: Holliday junction resolvase RuvX [Lutispora sp.]|nr:Holliday junction resolvase RuvX [Lutispora sp.]MDD4833553.1 Holliday junction resolvase RuvX [Lutispora sp.]